METQNKNKRQVYIWPENIDFFNELKNKSKTLNLLIRKYRQEVEYDGESGQA